jgi:hypothetical protein
MGWEFDRQPAAVCLRVGRDAEFVMLQLVFRDS